MYLPNQRWLFCLLLACGARQQSAPAPVQADAVEARVEEADTFARWLERTSRTSQIIEDQHCLFDAEELGTPWAPALQGRLPTPPSELDHGPFQIVDHYGISGSGRPLVLLTRLSRKALHPSVVWAEDVLDGARSSDFAQAKQIILTATSATSMDALRDAASRLPRQADVALGLVLPRDVRLPATASAAPFCADAPAADDSRPAGEVSTDALRNFLSRALENANACGDGARFDIVMTLDERGLVEHACGLSQTGDPAQLQCILDLLRGQQGPVPSPRGVVQVRFPVVIIADEVQRTAPTCTP